MNTRRDGLDVCPHSRHCDSFRRDRLIEGICSLYECKKKAVDSCGCDVNVVVVDVQVFEKLIIDIIIPEELAVAQHGHDYQIYWRWWGLLPQAPLDTYTPAA